MNCQYIGSCGSCTLGNLTYTEQLDFKIQREKKRFINFYNNQFDIIKSKSINFRNRIEFRIFHKLGTLSYAMNDINKKILPIENCDIVNINISNLMNILLKTIINNDILKQKFFSVEFLSSLDNDILITMIYHKKLDEQWIQEAKKLEALLKIKIIGRSRKQKIIISDDYILENLPLKSSSLIFKYYEGGFTQPNSEVNIQMINWVLQNIDKSSNDLCELYCGGGNFTLPLSQKFHKVLATEISKTSIRSAKENCKLNNISNIKFIRMSSEEFVEAQNGIREFRRLKQEDVILDNYNFDTIFVDPPRAGLDNTTQNLTKTFQQIIYISCNPETLYKDLEILTQTHKIKHFALFDQFAYTNHIECGVILEIIK